MNDDYINVNAISHDLSLCYAVVAVVGADLTRSTSVIVDSAGPHRRK